MNVLKPSLSSILFRFLGTGTTSDASALEADIASSAENQVINAFSSSTYQYFSWIGQHAPCFPICGDQVQVLTEPTQFFEVLKVCVLIFHHCRFYKLIPISTSDVHILSNVILHACKKLNMLTVKLKIRFVLNNLHIHFIPEAASFFSSLALN